MILIPNYVIYSSILEHIINECMTFINYSFAGIYGDESEKLANGISTSILNHPHSISLQNCNNHFCGDNISIHDVS